MLQEQDEEGLMRSDAGSQSVFNGVYSDKGRYQARSSTAACYENDLGHFGTPDEAAQAYGRIEEEGEADKDNQIIYGKAKVADGGGGGGGALFEIKHGGGKKRASDPSSTQQQHPVYHQQHPVYRPGCRVSVLWYGEAFTGTVLMVVDEGTRVKVLVDGNAKWEEHEYDAELKDVKPLVVVKGGHAVMRTDKQGKRKRKQQPAVAPPEVEQEGISEQQQQQQQQLGVDIDAVKCCKHEFIEEEHLALQQMVSAVSAAVQCSVCREAMRDASTLSVCGHTFCRSCIDKALRADGLCPVCGVPAWQKDIQVSRVVNNVLSACTNV
jgi:hypothetical protein